MPFRWNPKEHVALGRYVAKWLVIGVPTGAVVGAAVAGFLWLLERATEVRFMTDLPSGVPWLLFLLPVGGVAVGLVYHAFGKSVEAGNNLIMEQIHAPGGGVPARMAPLVLLGTVLTHLFGGSAGREGTAVQMGGSIASTAGKTLGLDAVDTRTLLMAGIAAGFGAVFGTPLTGAVFAVEVLAIGLVSFQSMVPCLIASVAGDWATRALGIHHTAYPIGALVRSHGVSRVPGLSWLMLAKVGAASVVFGLASVLFAELTHGLHRAFRWAMPVPYLRPAVGAVVVIGLAFAVGPDYLGLGVTNPPGRVSILTCFSPGGATALSWWWKILFTAVTLSCGFKGGEVTPLFFVGAALGNAMGRLLHAPVDLFAGLGFVAVFAGATNTPLACTIMGIELFAPGQADLLNGGFVVYLATACFVAYLLSGHSGIYLSQRIAHPKLLSHGLPPDANLRTARELTPVLGATLLANLSGTGTPDETDAGSDGSPGWIEVAPAESNGPYGGTRMSSHRHKVSAREIGQVRIYMTPGEKPKGKGVKALFAKPLYQQVIDLAKADGILNAVAHHTHYGYSGNGGVQANNHELPNAQMNLCVELIAPRDQLELFCRKHGDALKGKVIVYKHMEHWEIGTHDALRSTAASVEEMDADVTDEGGPGEDRPDAVP